MNTTDGTVSLPRALIGPFTTLSLGAAAIHFAVTQEHFQEWWAFGLFMVAVAWFQALWPIAYALRPGIGLAILAATANIATVGIWAWSRYAGLPFGPGANARQAIGVPDVVATAFELLLFVGLVATAVRLARGSASEPRVARPVSITWSAAVALVVAVATSLAITVWMG